MNKKGDNDVQLFSVMFPGALVTDKRKHLAMLFDRQKLE